MISLNMEKKGSDTQSQKTEPYTMKDAIKVADDIFKLTKDNEYKWFEVRITPVSENGRFKGAIGLACDIHEKKVKELEGFKNKNRRKTDI